MRAVNNTQWGIGLVALMAAFILMVIAIPHAQPAPDKANGQKLYQVCTTCHGANGEGNAQLHAPAIAGQSDWYLKTQLINFKSGIRGADERDLWGKTMAPMSMTLADAQAIVDVIAYIQTLPATKPAATLEGNATAGAKLYNTCVACHGADGKGNADLHAPNLTGLPDWYIVQQLNNFQSGVRGKHEKDQWGKTMAPMAMTLQGEQAILDVTAYIQTLGK